MKKFLSFCFIFFIASSVFARGECNNYWSAISPDGNHIYLSTDRHGDGYEIYRVDIDGHSNPMRLTNNPGVNKYYPSVSPDGSLIAFQAGDYNGAAEIYIMNSDGTNLQQLTSNSIYDGYPNFSPDGTKIVFDAWDESHYPEVFTMNIDGTERTQLTDEAGAFWQSAPIYNPAGTKIYFSAGFNADNYYVMMDLDGSNWVNITDPNDFGYSDWGLHFNAAGDKIIFYTMNWTGYQNGSDIVIADADGSNWSRITNSTDGKYYSAPFFHPTNDKIYYTFYWPGGTGKNAIHRMDMDGSNDEQISNCFAVGINENPGKSKWTVYPNPAKDFVTISIEDSFSYELFDLTGHSMLKSNQQQTSISHLPTGLYLVVIRDENKLVTGRLKFLKE